MARLIDSSWTISDSVSKYNCAYTGISKDGETGKAGKLYFLFEQFARDSSAIKAYAFIKHGNEKHGIKVLHDLGDEAYFHTDGTNFYFIIVRKGNRMFNMKVNKITGTTSLDEFLRVARNITAVI